MSESILPDAGTLHGLARRVAAHAWCERRLFEITGAWSAEESDPAVAVFFARESMLHAWRAEGWASRATRSVEVAVAPPDTGWKAVADLMADLSDTVARLAIWTDVAVPAMLVRYRQHRVATSEAADTGVRRWLDLVETDTVRGWLLSQDLLAAHVDEDDLQARLGGRVCGQIDPFG